MSPLEVVAAGPYNLFYSLAVAAAAASMFLAGRRNGWSIRHWSLAVAGWAAAGMLGAMLPHAIFGDAIAYRTAIGGVIFASLALGLIARAIRRDTAEVLDTTAVAIPLGASIVRVGCFLAGCCQGIVTRLPVGISIHTDEAPRHPVQLYESILELTLAMIIAKSARGDRGRRFANSVGGMCAIRFATEFVRDNDKFGGLSLAQWIVLPIGALCLILVLSRPRATKPKRVLTGGARRATIMVVGGLAIAAVTSGLPALESTVLLIGAALLLAVAIRRVGRMAPTGLAVLALQMPALSADSTYPRRYTFIGGGANFGSWTAQHAWGDCDGNHEEWTRRHSYTGASLEFGERTMKSQTRSNTLRAALYANIDQADAAVVSSGGGSPSSPGAYSRNSAGVQLTSDFDWKPFGLTLGGSVGRFYPAIADDNHGSANDHANYNPAFMPAIGLRFGPKRGVSFELRTGDEAPMWAPAPAATATIAIGDANGNRIRFGSTEDGLIVAGRQFTRTGLEITPTLVLPADHKKSLHFGIGFRKWVRAEPRPRAGR